VPLIKRSTSGFCWRCDPSQILFRQYRINIDSRQALKAEALVQKVASGDSIVARRGHLTCEAVLDR
jgi:hypothetical protein